MENLLKIFILTCCLSAAFGCIKLGSQCEEDGECCHDKCIGDICQEVPVAKDCTKKGRLCKENNNCCSRRCVQVLDNKSYCYKSEIITQANCKKDGESCYFGVDCCSKSCVDDSSGATCQGSDYAECTKSGRCTRNGDCCSGSCVPSNVKGAIVSYCDENAVKKARCRNFHNACDDDEECCSKVCNNGRCEGDRSANSRPTCKLDSDECSKNEECCSNDCQIDEFDNVCFLNEPHDR